MTTNSPMDAEAPDGDRLPAMLAWAADASAAAPALDALARSYRLDRHASLPPPEAVEGARPTLLLCQAPARMLARLMTQGKAPAAALRAWRGQVKAILALSRRNRRGVQVLDLAEALAHPRAFETHFGLPEGSADFPDPPARSNSREDMFLTLLAQRLLLGDSAARMAQAELEAISVSLTGTGPAAADDPEAAWQAYRAMLEDRDGTEALDTRARRLEAEIAELTARLQAAADSLVRAESAGELLLAQNRYMQEELEQLARRRAALEAEAARVPRLTGRLAAMAGSLKALDAAYRGQEATAEMLRADNARLQDRLARAERDLTGRQEELDRLAGQMHGIVTSRSYRLTAPLRRMRGLISRKGRA